MVFEDMTYEVIIQQMIDRVAEKYPNLDTREGSLVFNAVASAALEFAIAYTEIENALSESFVDTASREYLIEACKQMGMDIEMFDATSGTHKGEFDVEVPIDSRWNCELYNYTVTEYLGMENGYYTYKMLCETVGVEPNKHTGDLTAITDIPDGLNHAVVTECLIEGEDETSDEKIKTAYYEFVNSSVTDGNINQYKRWCDEYPGKGIGNSKVIPLWKGANTVKVSILSASNRAASQELIREFQNYLDPGVKGMGDGVAPIGAFVTVSTATEKNISVSANVTMKKGYTDTTPISDALTEYFTKIAYDKTVVAYMNVGAVILGLDCVDSISDLKVNNGTSDIALGDEEIPVLGTTSWVVN